MAAQQIKPLAVIVGGAGGMGFQLAEQFADHGYDLVIASGSSERLTEAAQALSHDGARVQTACADLLTWEGVERLAAELRGLGRPIDVLALNTGPGVGGDLYRKCDLDTELRVIELNVTAQVHLIRRLAPDMVERDRGQILITAQAAGVSPSTCEAVYAGSRAFLRAFGHALREELKDTGVEVTVLTPGPAESDVFERGRLGAKAARNAFDALHGRRIAGG